MKSEALVGGGQIAARVLSRTLKKARPGVSTRELDSLAEKLILEGGGRPSFKGFEDYPFATCININEGVVHGLPSKKTIIRKGDLVTVDLGVFYRGLHTDTARTVIVQSAKCKVQNSFYKFLETGREALEKAIEQCRSGNRIGDISYAIQRTIEEAGYYVIRELVGHGVGERLHQEPSIPGYGRRGEGPRLKEGMALAVEVIYAAEETKVKRLGDGWTLVTDAGCPAAMFEHTVLVTRSDPIVLTRLDKWAKIAKS